MLHCYLYYNILNSTQGIGDTVRPKNKFERQGEVYKTVVRPAMMYGAETWAPKKAQEKKLDVAEMRMLRWMSGRIIQESAGK